MKQGLKMTATLAVGVMVGALLAQTLLQSPQRGSGKPEKAADEPLYWVAPMDPDYRRDRPGKSPMGMDLVPVYAEEERAGGEGPGTIEISPEVVNNLGVRTAAVTREALETRIRTVGYVKYDEDRLIHIHPRVEGWIERLYVKAAGDPVTEGQPLYALYSPQLVNAQEELLLALKRSNERLVKAARDRLLALQLTPEFITELERERKVRQTITFRSSQSGVIDNLNIREGFYVMPGTTLMSVGALDDVWVEAEVFERQAAQVQVGQLVSMTLDYLPGRQWQGRVDYIYPSLEEKTRTLRVRLRFSNESGVLKPNMYAQVQIHTVGDVQALVVPREAVIRTGDQDRVVLALGEGRFKSIAVSLGRMDEQSVEVLEGLHEGDEVVVSAQFLLDSESSKSSDFRRMHRESEMPAGDDAHSRHHHSEGQS
ncbi:MAG: efflux RND transporter periplasmic adaptor subunit [Haliea sp.]|jgi:Cu(I)/Ag(I) efflux system membrane fusion protein|nr:efflux RND transporter periplasmic adaptor subunit [Haliea sp.]